MTEQIAIVEAVRTGPVQTHQWDGRRVVSACNKTRREGSVALGELGFDGDDQADRRHHGGIDKAVLVYAGQNYQRWAAEQGLDIEVGGFFENITLGAIEGRPAPDEQIVRLGERWRLGTAVVQVTQQRSPCYKLARRWQVPDLVERVQATGWSGWYLRVLTPGLVAAGDVVELLERPADAPTVAEVARVLNRDKADLAGARALLGASNLLSKMREKLQRRLAGVADDDAERVRGPVDD